MLVERLEAPPWLFNCFKNKYTMWTVLSFLKPAAICFLLLLLVAGCEKNDDHQQDRYERFLHANSQLVLSRDTNTVNNNYWNYEIVPGTKMVAAYVHFSDPSENIIDEELTTSLFFEFDPSQGSFVLEDSALWNASGLYREDCYCRRTSVRIAEGRISGQKLDNKHWEMDIDIRFQKQQFDSTVLDRDFQLVDQFTVQ